MSPGKQLVVSTGVSKTSYAEVVELCRQWADERGDQTPGQARFICVTSVHGLIVARDNPAFAEVLNSADVITPDGMPIVWALRSLGCRGQQRVYGPTLMLELCRSAAAHGHGVFLYGGRPAVLQALEAALVKRFPTLRVAGRHAPPFRRLSAEEDYQEQQLIRASGANLVFVGLGTPKQEQWMYDHRGCFPGMTLIGVGAAFDFHAGSLRQAPPWMQRAGLEWLFRLAVEPARLWRRYLLITPRFLPLWLGQLLKSIRESRP